MTDIEMNDFVDLLRNPRRNWPMYFTPEDVLCERAAVIITNLRKQVKRLKNAS